MQLETDVEPGDELYVPAGHTVHDDAPVDELYVPLGQSTHTVPPTGYCPIGHEHTVAPVGDVVQVISVILSEPFPLFDAVSVVTVAPEIA